MPIPSSINDLDVNPNNNSPQGSETVGPNANGYLQALSAFIKQLAVGTGLKPTAAVDMNGQKITNIAQGTISSTSKDAVRGDQLYKVGEVRMYHGAAANIATVWGAGWQLCDGTNGTADLRDRFVVGAGNQYSLNDKGGNASVSLSVANMPAHGHTLNDPGHVHDYLDNGHIHPLTDPGHGHAFERGTMGAGAPGGAGWADPGYGGIVNVGTTPSSTGISMANVGVGILIRNAVTNITMSQTGSGTAVDIRPPYYALCFIEYVGP